MRVLVVGASGVIGRQLVPRLVARGHRVAATTRSADRLDLLRSLGAEPAVLDALDPVAVGDLVARSEPEAIVDELTALAGPSDMRHFDRWFAATNELRTKGTDHLLAAAHASGVQRFVAQSYTGWTNPRTGGPVKTEADPLDLHPARAQARTLAAIRYLERAVVVAPLEGIVVRYGSLYGPGASDEIVALVRRRMMPVIGSGAGVWSWTHVEDAAAGTVAALERGTRGTYAIVDDEPAPVSAWLPYLAEAVGAAPPRRVPAWLGRLLAGEVAVQWMTEGRGASNEKARRELGWEPAWRSWREGFGAGLTPRPAATAPERERVPA